MKNNHRSFLVKDSLDLLRQVRAGITNDSDRSLCDRVDEAIVKLEAYLSADTDDPGHISEVLKILAQGLAAIPGLQRLIDLVKEQ